MKRFNRGSRRGFSLVELLAVVLILAVLAGVAIPLYINSRKSAAARACIANIAAIASAESAYALRNGSYAATTATLVGKPEGLSRDVTCPLANKSYTLDTTTVAGGLTITCQDAAAHATVVGQSSDYSRTMAPPAVETLP